MLKYILFFFVSFNLFASGQVKKVTRPERVIPRGALYNIPLMLLDLQDQAGGAELVKKANLSFLSPEHHEKQPQYREAIMRSLGGVSHLRRGHIYSKGKILSFFSEALGGLWGTKSFLPREIKKKLICDQASPTEISHGVVLIHGLRCLPQAWVFARQWLKEHGMGEVLMVKYDYNQSITKSCQDVWQQIRENLPAGIKLSFVGHSLGGLVARAMISHEDCLPRDENGAVDEGLVNSISSVFSLASPLRGVIIINAISELLDENEVFPPVYSDMQVGSDFIEKFRQGSIARKHVTDLYELASLNDPLVDPRLALTDARGVKHRMILGTAGHALPVLNKGLWKKHIIRLMRRSFK